MQTNRFALVSALVLVIFIPARAGKDADGVLDRFYDAYRKGSVEEMLALYGPQAVFEDVSQRHTFKGSDELRQMLTGIVGIHQTIDLEEKRRVVQGDTIVVEYDYRGMLPGPARSAMTGKEGCPALEYTLPATSWYRIVDGLIVHQKDFIDFATFLDLREQALQASLSHSEP